MLRIHTYLEDENGYEKYVADRKAFFESEEGQKFRKYLDNPVIKLSAKKR